MKKLYTLLIAVLAILYASAGTQKFDTSVSIPGLATESANASSDAVTFESEALGTTLSIVQCYKGVNANYLMAVKSKGEISFTTTKAIQKISITTPSSGTLAGNATLALYIGDATNYDCYNNCKDNAKTYDFIPTVKDAGTTYKLKNIKNPLNTSKDGNVQIASITILYEGETEVEPVEPKTIQVSNIGALIEANKDIASGNDSYDHYEITNPVTAVYQNGSNLYIKDETGFILVFGSTGQTYKNGDVIPAGIQGNYSNYYNLPEFKPIKATFAAGTAGTPVEPASISIEDVNAEAISSYVKIEGVTITNMQSTLSNFQITDPVNNTSVIGRNNFKIDAVNGDNLTVYGFTVKYNQQYQIYPIEITSASGLDVVSSPVFSPSQGEVNAGTEVKITSATDGASIYYTLNNDEPTTSSTLYTAPIVIDKDVTIKAIAVKDGMENSAVATAAYTVKVIGKNVAMFDFTMPATLNPAYPADINGEDLTPENSNKSAKVSNVHFYNGNVAVTSTKGKSTDAKIYYQSGGAIQLRVYDGGSTTIQSTDPDNNIIKIVFDYNSGAGNVTGPTAGWEASTGTWTGDAQKIEFNYTGSVQINSVEVYCAKDLTAEKPVENPKVNNVAETLELNANSLATVNYDLTVGYVKGSNIFAKDATGAFIQIYGTNSYNVGDVIPAGWDATYALRNSIPQLTPENALPTATEGTFTPETVTATEITTDKVNYVLKINDVVLSEASPATKANFTGMAGETEISFYNNYTLPSVEPGKYNITFVVSLYNNATSLYVINFEDSTSGIDDIEADGTDVPAEYFNMQGVRVENPQNGLYIKRQGTTVTKVIIR